MIKQAEVAQEIQINHAKGIASAMLERNNATVKSFEVNQWAQLQAYTKLKSELKLTEDEFLNYLNKKLVTTYPGDRILINL